MRRPGRWLVSDGYAAYDALDGIRFSRLKLMRKSPLHYAHAVDKDTANRGFLRAVHCLVLEPWRFDDLFVVDAERQTASRKGMHALANVGKTVIKPADETKARNIANAVRTHPAAGPLFTGEGQSEVPMQWRHPGTGLLCKALRDRWTRDKFGQRCLVDLKTYGTTDPDIVGWRVYELGAHIQMAHYEEGARLTSGEDDIKCMIVSAESGPPWDVAVFEIDRLGALHAGQVKREELLARVAECEKTGRWPGRFEDVQVLDLPSRAYPADEDGSLETENLFGPESWAAKEDAS